MRVSLNRKAIAWMLGLIVGISVLMEAVVFRVALSALRPSGQIGCACSGALLHTPWLLYGIAALFLFGLLGGFGLLFRSTISSWRIRRHLGNVMEVSGHKVLLSARSCEVFTFGLLRPQIAICSHCVKALQEEELRAVLTHEENHVNHRDPLKLLLVQIARVSFFFIPLVHTLGAWYKKTIELDADTGVANTEALGSALLRLMDTRGQRTAVTYFASTLEERIERILNPAWRLRLKVSRLGLVLSVIVLFGGLGVGNLYPHGVQSPRMCVVTPVCNQTPVDRNQNHYYTL